MECTTSLSMYVWKLKRNNIPFDIRWKLVAAVPAYRKESQRCLLCLTEKTAILFGDRNLLLNKRSEIMNPCKHKDKHKLSKIT